MMNKDKLTHILHKVSTDKDVSFNMLLQVFFFESLLYRISKSKYRDIIILKGGFLLSSILGITQRSTLDLDFSFCNSDFSKSTIEKILHEIITLEVKDDIEYQLLNINEIKQLSEYLGFQVSIIGKFENIRVPFTIDFANGDPITPQGINYNYHPLIIENDFLLRSYNIETVLAEKLQTIISKKIGNSRMKDFYDVYIISKLNDKLFNIDVLKKAVGSTFAYRKTEFIKSDFLILLNGLEEDQDFINRWNNYARKNQYVVEVTFLDVKNEIIKLIEKV